MALVILRGAYLLALVRGSMVIMAVADSTGAGRDSMVVGRVFMAVGESDITADSAAAPLCAAAVDSTVSPHRAEGVASTEAADSMEGAGAGNCYSFLLFQLDGWQLDLPAVFYFC
jgi:hypothetical protein